MWLHGIAANIVGCTQPRTMETIEIQFFQNITAIVSRNAKMSKSGTVAS